MKTLFFLTAILTFCAAHYLRVMRWELFIRVYEKPDRRRLLQALSLGYLLNFFLPMKSGDLFRAWFSGRRMRSGKSLGFSTVVIDRLLDIICVGLIFLFLSTWNPAMLHNAAYYIALAALLLAIIPASYLGRQHLKKVIRAFASVFNTGIEAAILQFSWALIWNFKDIASKINRAKLLITTMGMWCMYLTSYLLFTVFLGNFGINLSVSDIFILLFTQNSIKLSTAFLALQLPGLPGLVSPWLSAYLLLPLAILWLASFAHTPIPADNAETYLKLLPHLDRAERLDFLENYFSGANRTYMENYLKINQGISIIRDFSAGSNATTMLCMDNDSTFFRKYAFGAESEKLYSQILWLKTRQALLPLPEILRQEKADIYCYYDMPYRTNAVGLFEYAHSMPIENSWHILESVLQTLEHTVHACDIRPADKATIDSYIRTKVSGNLDKIISAKRIRALLGYDTISINGELYPNLSYYEKYLSPDYLQKVFSRDSYAVIHGDLTIENIVCTRDVSGHDGFYLIDPNTGNLHESPNLDYAKLLQSIHGGYEFLMATKEISVKDNRITFLFTRSSAYEALHTRLRHYMLAHFGEEQTRSIYFHEIVHWLRLMPYKIEKDGDRALLFYAGMLIVLRDVIADFGKEES